MAAHERIAELSRRVDQLVLAPDEAGGRFGKLVARVYRFFGWQAKLEHVALRALFASEDPRDDAAAEKRLKAALDEAETNIGRAERAAVVHRYVPTAHASWLTRVLDILRRFAADDGSPAASRVLSGLDSARALPPLSIDTTLLEKGIDGVSEALPESEVMAQARLFELQLAAIDHIAEAARAETSFLERRRRLLEGARRLLLDTAAAVPLEQFGLRARERWVASQITHIDRLEAAGLDARVALGHQAKHAARRGDRDRLYAALLALDGFALAVGDREVGDRTGRALDSVPGVDVARSKGIASEQESFARSANEIFGAPIVTRMGEIMQLARDKYARDPKDPELQKMALEFLAPGCDRAALAALMNVDGCFEVGAALSPIRAREQEEVARLVAHPTPEMLLVQARSIEDLRTAVLDDPRSLLLDLAAGRLLSRKFVARSTREVERIRLVGEARVYVLDGSSSMLTDGIDKSRARMRDAIVLAELATMMRRLEQPGRNVRLSLYFRYFTLKLGPLHRVRTADEALAAMGEVLGTVREGGTNIQQAIVSSLELIRDAKREDPDLARANIVLVTDGNAPIDGDALHLAREGTAGVSVAVSVIALGEENPVLRELAARQRARGERSFYHFVDDERLAELCTGELRALHLPAGPPLADVELRDRIEEVIRELDDLEITRRSTGVAANGAAPGVEGQRALQDAEGRDSAAVVRRYHRWFPRINGQVNDATTASGSDLEVLRILLATIAEVVGELGGSELRRQADAIELIERLLPDARLTPARYHAVIERDHAALADAFAAVHAAVGGADVGYLARLAAAQRKSRAR